MDGRGRGARRRALYYLTHLDARTRLCLRSDRSTTSATLWGSSTIPRGRHVAEGALNDGGRCILVMAVNLASVAGGYQGVGLAVEGATEKQDVGRPEAGAGDELERIGIPAFYAYRTDASARRRSTRMTPRSAGGVHAAATARTVCNWPIAEGPSSRHETWSLSERSGSNRRRLRRTTPSARTGSGEQPARRLTTAGPGWCLLVDLGDLGRADHPLDGTRGRRATEHLNGVGGDLDR